MVVTLYKITAITRYQEHTIIPVVIIVPGIKHYTREKFACAYSLNNEEKNMGKIEDNLLLLLVGLMCLLLLFTNVNTKLCNIV